MIELKVNAPESKSDIYISTNGDGDMQIIISEESNAYSSITICQLQLPKMVTDAILMHIMRETTDRLYKETKK